MNVPWKRVYIGVVAMFSFVCVMSGVRAMATLILRHEEDEKRNRCSPTESN